MRPGLERTDLESDSFVIVIVVLTKTDSRTALLLLEWGVKTH